MIFKIVNRIIGPNHDPVIIAEIGINHNGNLDNAFYLAAIRYLGKEINQYLRFQIAFKIQVFIEFIHINYFVTNKLRTGVLLMIKVIYFIMTMTIYHLKVHNWLQMKLLNKSIERLSFWGRIIN